MGLKSTLTLYYLVPTKGHTYLNKPVYESCKFVWVCVNFNAHQALKCWVRKGCINMLIKILVTHFSRMFHLYHLWFSDLSRVYRYQTLRQNGLKYDLMLCIFYLIVWVRLAYVIFFGSPVNATLACLIIICKFSLLSEESHSTGNSSRKY